MYTGTARTAVLGKAEGRPAGSVGEGLRKAVGVVVGLATTAYLFACAEVNGWYSVQALRAHWYRLYTTDPPAAAFLLLHALTLFAGIRRSGRGVRFGGALAAICGGSLALAAGCRPTTAVFLWLLVPVGVGVRLANPRAFRYVVGVGAIAVGGILLQVAVALLLHLGYRGGLSASGYIANYRLDAQTISQTWPVYRTMIETTYGPLLVLSVLLFFSRAARYFWPRRRWAVLLRREGMFLYALGALATAVAMFLPWASPLPRYLWLAHVWAVAVIGLEWSVAVEQVLGASGRRARSGWRVALEVAVGGAGMLALGWRCAWLAIGLVAGAWVSLGASDRIRQLCQPCLVGAAVVCLGYVVASGVVSQRAFEEFVPRQERLRSELIDWLETAGRLEPQVVIVGTPREELIAALRQVLASLLPQSVSVRIAEGEQEIPPGSLVVLVKHLVPKGFTGKVLQSKAVLWRAGGPSEVQVPAGFEQWRLGVITAGRWFTTNVSRPNREWLVIRW